MDYLQRAMLCTFITIETWYNSKEVFEKHGAKIEYSAENNFIKAISHDSNRPTGLGSQTP